MKKEIKNMEFIKEPNKKHNNYIFQNNNKTQLGTSIIIVILGLIILAVVISGIDLNTIS